MPARDFCDRNRSEICVRFRVGRDCEAPYPEAMSARPQKHSLTLRGHRTSVSLEAAFWDAFRAIAAERGQTLNQLATEIDAGRDGEVGLASAIRVFILSHFRR